MKSLLVLSLILLLAGMLYTDVVVEDLHVQIGDINTFRATNGTDIDLGLMGHYWDYTALPDQGRYILSIIDKKDATHPDIAVQATMVMKYSTMDSIVEMYISKGMQSIDAHALVFKGGTTEIQAYGFRTPIILFKFPTQVGTHYETTTTGTAKMTGFPIPIPITIILKFDGVVDGQVKVPEHNGRVYDCVVLKNYMKISDSFNLFPMETWTYYWIVPNRVPMVLINGGDSCPEFFTHAESVYQLLKDNYTGFKEGEMSVSKLPQKQVLQANPSPFRDRLMVVTSKPAFIYNIAGKLVYALSAGEFTVDTSKWAATGYIIKSGKESKKITKIN
jgi:hypothetical protein